MTSISHSDSIENTTQNVEEAGCEQSCTPVVHTTTEWALLEPGANWQLADSVVAIEQILSSSLILVRNLATGKLIQVNRADLSPVASVPIALTKPLPSDVYTEEDVTRAKQIESAVAPFVETELSATQRKGIADSFRVATKTVSRWVARYRVHRTYRIFLPQPRGAKKGVSTLREEVEVIIRGAIKDHFDGGHSDITVNAIYDVIEHRCAVLKLVMPATGTIQTRINEAKKDLKNYPADVRKILEQERKLIKGNIHVDRALAFVQADHTPLDIPVNDPVTGKSIGCPYLTLIFDVRTRVVLGFCLTLEAPSQLSTALALHHAVFPKETWLKSMGITGPWPFYGIPC